MWLVILLQTLGLATEAGSMMVTCCCGPVRLVNIKCHAETAEPWQTKGTQTNNRSQTNRRKTWKFLLVNEERIVYDSCIYFGPLCFIMLNFIVQRVFCDTKYVWLTRCGEWSFIMRLWGRSKKGTGRLNYVDLRNRGTCLKNANHKKIKLDTYREKIRRSKIDQTDQDIDKWLWSDRVNA